MVSGESSSSQSAIADSNSIPSVLAHLPKLDELQPFTTSEVVPILASEIVVKDSVDKGFVVRGPVDHALSIQANEEQRAACEQSFQAKDLEWKVVTNGKLKVGELSSSQKNVQGLQAPPSPILQQVLQENSDDSEADLLEVLEGVVSSVINDPSNSQKATASPTSIANNPTVNTPSKQPTKAEKKASKAAWSDNRISPKVPIPDGDEKEPPDLLSDVKLLLGGSSKADSAIVGCCSYCFSDQLAVFCAARNMLLLLFWAVVHGLLPVMLHAMAANAASVMLSSVLLWLSSPVGDLSFKISSVVGSIFYTSFCFSPAADKLLLFKQPAAAVLVSVNACNCYMHIRNWKFKLGSPALVIPKKSSPARELQVPGDRLESEERLSSLVRSLEAEMKSSGVLVDCTELKSQLNRLKEHHDLIGCQSSVSDASGESSSSQSAIEVSNGIPSVLVDLPNLDEVQPTTTSEVVPILASEIVVKDSVGIVVKGPVVHAPSNQANGGQRAACAQSIQGQVVTNEKLKLGELTSSQKNVLGLRAPPSPVLQQVLQEDSDDSEADLLEVLEGVVRSVINDPSNFQKATTSPTSIANNPTVITPSKQPTKAAKKASKAAWSDNRISQHVPNPDAVVFCAVSAVFCCCFGSHGSLATAASF
ncbi:hypothetical protein RHMOL_RhmolUnG0004000 [Rhododendron molle]|nr:hypothetical protein RHMOL_RhmolUnG0004000 [Rhododendron molle]